MHNPRQAHTHKHTLIETLSHIKALHIDQVAPFGLLLTRLSGCSVAAAKCAYLPKKKEKKRSSSSNSSMKERNNKIREEHTAAY